MTACNLTERTGRYMKEKNTFDKVLFLLALVSFLLAMLEGFFYYGDLNGYGSFRFLMILQNSLAAFLFDADISTSDVVGQLGENASFWQKAVGYAYAVAVVAAPLCTAAVLYRVLEVLLNWRIHLLDSGKRERILICGYNEKVHTLLTGKTETQRIWVVTKDEVPAYLRQDFLKKGISFCVKDCLACSEADLKGLFREIGLSRIQKILLFENTSEKNFSLYYMFANHTEALAENVKLYCSCEDEGIQQMLEDYYNDGKQQKIDLETFSLSELQVRELYRRRPLQDFYKNSDQELRDRKVHLLIAGFSGLGRQVLLQSMNLGVVSAENEILIDVVDLDAKKQKSVFASRFHASYVKARDKGLVISGDDADGNMRIRFHKIDVQSREYGEFLEKAGMEYPFTYAAICIKDPKVSMRAFFETERFLKRQGLSGRTPLAVRMDMNSQMARYLAKDHAKYDGVEVINGGIGFELIFDSKNNEMARKYHEAYRNTRIRVTASESADQEAKDTAGNNWSSLTFFRRDSNRALAYHGLVKRELLKQMEEKEASLIKSMNDPESLLCRGEGEWVFRGTEAELADYINRTPFLKDMVMTEHRRWCYFMASEGWGYTQGEKNDVFRENPCMINWKKLCLQKPEMCKYDLIPWLIVFEELQQENSD